MAYIPPNPNGQATSANSAPVVIASDNVVDIAGNQVIGTGSITAADTGVTGTAGQNNQNLLTGTPTAGSAYALAIPTVNGSPESFSSIVIQISGTFVGTYQFERSPDGGTTWTAFALFTAGTPITGTSGTLPGQFHGNIAGVTNVRVRATAYTSGTINVRFSLGIGTGTITVGNALKLVDRTANIQATIKDVSTAPAATDTSLVTTTSPNSPDISSLTSITTNTANIPTVGQKTSAASTPVVIASDQTAISTSRLDMGTGGSISATGTIVTLTVNGQNSITWAATGTFVASYQVQVTVDGGTNWFTISSNATIWNTLTGATVASTLSASGATYRMNITGYNGVRFVCTAYTSGTLNIGARASAAIPSAAEGIAQTSQQGVVSTNTYLGPNTSSPTLISYFNNAITALTLVKGSTGRLHRIMVQNPNTSGAWLQIFNKATTASTALGTDPPALPVYIPASGYFEDFFEYSDSFSAGIVIAATTTANGSTLVTNGLVVSLGYA